MPATPAGNRKIAANLKKKHGTGPDGKSLFHKELGRKGQAKSSGYFARLKENDPDKLEEISRRGANNMHRKAKMQNQFKYGLHDEEEG
jgi:general stress protein YciG